MDQAGITIRFSYHQPSDVRTSQEHDEVRGSCRALALALDKVLPDSREKAVAMTKLEEAMMWANAAIARAPAWTELLESRGQAQGVTLPVERLPGS